MDGLSIWAVRLQYSLTVNPFGVSCFWRVPCSLYVNESLCGFRVNLGATSRTGTAYPSRAPEFNPDFQWGSCYSICSFLCGVLWIVVCPYSFGHCVVCPSSIYLLLLPIWYLQTLLDAMRNAFCFRSYPTLHIFPVSNKSHFPIFIFLHPFYIFLTYC